MMFCDVRYKPRIPDLATAQRGLGFGPTVKFVWNINWDLIRAPMRALKAQAPIHANSVRRRGRRAYQRSRERRTRGARRAIGLASDAGSLSVSSINRQTRT